MKPHRKKKRKGLLKWILKDDWWFSSDSSKVTILLKMAPQGRLELHLLSEQVHKSDIEKT